MIESIVIDPPDDLLKGFPFTRSNLRRLVAEYKRWGLKRVYWQHYGGEADGMWDDAGEGCNFTDRQAAAATFGGLGDPLRALCDTAHEAGLQVYAILKPFDHGHGITGQLPENSPLVERYGRLKRVGGYTRILARYLQQNPSLLLQRFPTLPSRGPALPISEIRFFSQDDLPATLDLKRLCVWTSAHNDTYTRYPGKARVEERIAERRDPVYCINWNAAGPSTKGVRMIRISGLEISDPFMAVAYEGAELHGSFSNKLYALAELIDVAGEPALFTYGLTARDEERLRPGVRFQAASVSFDLPTFAMQARMIEEDPIRAPYSLDNAKGFIAFGRGKNPSLYGAACPAYPEVRSEWLRWIRDCLACGVDGVSIRTTSNHNRTLEWEAYGFNPPAVESFRQRYGVDVTKEPFDRALWWKHCGSFYTLFLREAAHFVRGAARRFQIMVEPAMLTASTQVRMLGMEWDWPAWISEGLADEICLFKVQPDHPRWPEVTFAAKSKAMPLCWALELPAVNPDSAAERLCTILDQCNGAGVSDVMLYENCSVLKLAGLDEITSAAPQLVRAMASAH